MRAARSSWETRLLSCNGGRVCTAAVTRRWQTGPIAAAGAVLSREGTGLWRPPAPLAHHQNDGTVVGQIAGEPSAIDPCQCMKYVSSFPASRDPLGAVLPGACAYAPGAFHKQEKQLSPHFMIGHC